ncbi:LysE family transporter [Seleniivibrio woodruffii]|uniref:Threonine/homoserine/homoserine lactone efflux protein n=1 Tax=Seleniivibrio woodruffii TaxID=1078050 RepID=A0A4R1KFS0_9BACT|nr:LysE family transporter [Seleniivibrio woodruffii]TCK62159.1 threonine/homoserine/homoserine lactone efflux protein [Seleniivibrio woodruffii]TVZ34724.1 cysteine/O-acetylserine efflux protein [Seleniivibrio woodruffii]
MPSAVLLSFLLYVAISTFTPGPNNLISMNTARMHGFSVTFRLIAGISSGFFTVIVLSALLSAGMMGASENYLVFMKYTGAAYIVWLAWIVFKEKPEESLPRRKAPTFLTGFLLQFMNVKGLLYGLTVVSGFILPYYDSAVSIILFALLLAFISAMSTFSWGLAGSFFKRFLNKHYKIANAVMAILLLECAFSLLFTKF